MSREPTITEEEVEHILMKNPMKPDEMLTDFFMLYRGTTDTPEEIPEFKVFAQNKEMAAEELMFVTLDIIARVMSESPNQVVSMTGDAVLEAIDTVERVVKLQQAEAAKAAIEH